MRHTFRHIWSPGIRIQLMLWYTVVFALLILLSDTILYAQLRTSLIDSLNTALQLRAQQVASGITDDSGTITIRDVTGALLDVGTTASDLPDTSIDVDFGTLVRVMDGRGQILRVSPAFQTLILSADSLSQPLHGHDWTGSVMTRDGQEVRLYSIPLVDNNVTFAVVQVGQSLFQLNRALHSMIIEVLLISPFVLLLSALGSYWLGTRAFSPINRLIRTAQHIKAGDLQQRVPVPRAYDEVRFLAITLNEMIESLDQTFTRQRRFVADASHELRTPVTAIRSMTELAQLRRLTLQEHDHILSDINQESERLGYLISDLLALARADEGQTILEQEPVHLDLLVEAVTANASLLASEHGIDMQTQILQPVTIIGDEARLIQAIMNLLDNAILYTNAGGKVVVKVDADATHAHLSICDTGIGIAPEHIPHLFERFYRVDPARTRREGTSSGLGLAIADWIIHAHKGAIVVESQLGVGSTFTVNLSLATGNL